MERMTGDVPNAFEHIIENFHIRTRRDEHWRFDHTAQEANTMTGGREDHCRLVNECGNDCN
jgi:hypothetical protein